MEISLTEFLPALPFQSTLQIKSLQTYLFQALQYGYILESPLVRVQGFLWSFLPLPAL